MGRPDDGTDVTSYFNLEFNAHFLDTVLASNLTLLECPITFHARVGKSKGGNVNDFRAVQVGIRMIFGLLFGWKKDLT